MGEQLSWDGSAVGEGIFNLGWTSYDYGHLLIQEDAHARQESERLRIEQQIQAERRAAEQYAVRAVCGGRQSSMR